MLRRMSHAQVLLLFGVVLLVLLFVSAGMGALRFSPTTMVRYTGHALGLMDLQAGRDTLGYNIFWKLRVPRVLMAGLTGAVLGVSGALMQGLFRNPIVEPGLAGTSAGAALGASFVFVFGDSVLAGAVIGPLLLVPLFGFLGGFAATMIVYRLSSAFGRVNVFTLLLAGIAVNAICSAGTGFLSYVARDPQARNIIFWNLGTFTTATWRGVALVGVAFAICFAWTLRHGKSLNALMLGEDEAAYLGVDPQRLIYRMLVVNTAMVAVATALTGVIAFIGLAVPHVLRMLKSSDYAWLLPGSALFGAAVMEAIDVIARIIIPPAELPIGIITAVVGAPVFLWILLRQRRTVTGYAGVGG
jgi:heme transport system permease protein